ncbi:hypothetical protein BGW38_004259 [Lunasporangiospora selenospora]|uniref:Actin-like ATPase domain-containing protein n=1 Tax=Lunasporangiospora selenospora TaxID=979761 RepID=A0A9P6FQR1_9FUNG|nr:hypothetical protein BGW38_004259 [Lunasporangiospora selenospora]
MQQRPFDVKEFPIVVAIDFGTTFSGCSYAYAPDEKEVYDVTKWPRQSIQYCKTPTLNLYKKADPEHKLVAWGWNAKLEMQKPTARHHILLQQYKLHLDESLHNAPLAVEIHVLDAIAQYLEVFHDYVVSEIMRGFGKSFQQDHFRYCLTVPAMWSDRAKSVMRQAAIRANLIKETDHPERLMLVSEPEAAALYCERKCDQFELGHGDRFMICDAGGGTVDLIVFEIEKTSVGRRLSEVTKGHGASCGSVFVDRNMKVLLEERFGHHVINFPATIIPSLVDTFADTIKPQFDGVDDHFLPLPAKSCFEDIPDPEALGIDDGCMILRADELRDKVFEPVVRDILALIDNQLNQARTCSAIFMVGGFGSSSYLHTRVEQEFGRRVGCVSVPPRPELAVVRGAAYVGLNPRVVTARITRRCYGIEMRRPFEEGIDPYEKRKVGVDGIFCFDRFWPLVVKGQRLNVDECVSKDITFTKWQDRLEDSNVTLYSSEADGAPPRYITDYGVSKLANIRIPCPFTHTNPIGTEVKAMVSMFFGQSEIKAEVKIHNNVYSTTLQFDAVDTF